MHKFYVSILFLGLLSPVWCQKCTYTSPSGNQYDFAPLRDNSEDYFVYVNGWNTWLNMCGPTITAVCGIGKAACEQWNPSTPAGKASLGLSSTMTFSGDDDQITAEFINGTDGRTMNIAFTCNQTAGVGYPYFNSENPAKNYNFVWPTSSACGCSQNDVCQDCAGSGCKWCLDTNSCIGVSSDNSCKSYITNPQYCPSIIACAQFGSCSDCLEYNDQCDWCLDTQSCINISGNKSCGNVWNDPSYCNSSRAIIIN